MNKEVEIFSSDTNQKCELPFAQSGISAGFPSPADDYLEPTLDLNKELVKNPDATFYGRVRGTSMQDLNIEDGDLLVIDKSLEAKDGVVAVCVVDGEFTIKKVSVKRDKVLLVPANTKFKTIEVTEENSFVVWGIVTYVIKKV